MKVVTLGEIMIRLQPYDHLRFVQTDTLQMLSKKPYERRMKEKKKSFEEWQKQQERQRKQRQRKEQPQQRAAEAGTRATTCLWCFAWT